MRRLFIARAALLALILSLFAAPALSQVTGTVTDLANVIPDETEAALVEKLNQNFDATHIRIAVLTTPTTGGEPIEQWSMRAALRWYASDPQETRRVLYLLAVNDRRHRIEVSDAMRPSLPDDNARVILDTARPQLRAHDYAGAVQLVTEHLLRTTQRSDPGVAVAPVPVLEPEVGGSVPVPVPLEREPQGDGSISPTERHPNAWMFGLLLLMSILFVPIFIVVMIFRAIKAGSGSGQSTHGADTSQNSMFFSSNDSSSYSSSNDSSSYSSSSDSSSSSYSSSSDSSSYSSSDSGSSSGFSGGGASSDW